MLASGPGLGNSQHTFMKQRGLGRRRLVTYLLATAGILLCCSLGGAVLTKADSSTSSSPAWAAPGATAIRKVSPIDTSQHEPNFLNNLDCTLLTYRTSDGNTMQSGCFTDTAFGLMDSDSDTVIFNGTDEGLPLLPYSEHQVLVPWPKALSLVSLDAASTGGSYLSLYRNPLASLRDHRNTLFKLTAKALTAPPDLAIKDTAGRQLVINPQTMAFSNGGSWLVAETLAGSFVRINLATLDITAFAPSFGSQGSPALLKSQVTVSDDGHYVAIANAAAGSFKVYDLTACESNVDLDAQPPGCGGHDYSVFIGQQVRGFQSARHVRFVNDGLLSFEAQTSDPSSGGIYELAPADKITSLIDYLAVGDSYTSGEGVFDYLDGTDTPDNMCHLSGRSYPLLLTHDLFSEIGGHSVACSGATINDIASTSPNYRGQVRNVASLQQLQQSQSVLLNSIMANYLPGYVAQQRFVRQYQPAVITVSVGGDDIGFGDIVQKCVLPHVSLHLSDSDCYDTYEDRLEVTQLVDRTIPRWTALYKQLRSEAPDGRLYVVGYPEVVADTGNCALNAHLGKDELEFAAELIDYLNGGIRQAATNAGITYVDISQALSGHRLCEAAGYDVAVNGLTAGSDAGVLGLNIFGKESYHPNALGQALIEQAILKQTHNLTDTLSVTPVAGPDSHAMLNAPKTGRAVNTVVPDDSLTAGLVQPGQHMTVQASGSADGLKASTAYSIHLDGPTGPVIGVATSDASGDISTVATLPEDTAAGSHTIDVTGENQADEPVDITQPIYVPASDNDADGDGIPNVLDTCPGAVNSGQDSDQDGIDDSCDPAIGPAPPAQALGGSSGSGDGQPTGNQAAGQAAEPTANTDELAVGSSVPAGGLSSFLASFGTSNSVATSRLLTDKSIRSVAVITKGSGGTALGTATNNIKPLILAGNGTIHGGKHFAKLPTIKWLPRLLLPAIFWFLILLGLYAKRFLGKESSSTRLAGYRTRVYINVSKLGGLDYNRLMIWVRKGIVHLLSLVLLASLVGGALAVSANINLTHPQKLETWLGQGNFYSGVVTNVLHNAQQSASNDTGAGRVSLSDPTFQQAVRAVFTPQLLKQYTNTVLDSNYAWLEGKTAAPQFTIDLKPAKHQLAQQVGQSVESRLSNLTVCSDAQLTQLQATLNTDPLAIPCLLPTLNPQTASAQATKQINGSSDFLNNPVITASALNPNGDNQGKPYYQRLSKAPTLYKWGQRLPWICGGLILLSTLGIIFIAPRKRRGVRRLGVVVLEAGIILLIIKFVADTAFNRLEKRIFNNSSIGQLQQSLTDFLHRIEAQLVKVDFWFGIAFLAIGVLLLSIIWFTRDKADKPAKRPKPDKPKGGGNDLFSEPPAPSERPPLPVFKQPPRSNKPNRPKPPRLIQ
jgi:hypothetical protein